MKKFTKIMLLIILILGLGGGVLFGAGLAAGGTIDMVCDGNHLADTRLFPHTFPQISESGRQAR